MLPQNVVALEISSGESPLDDVPSAHVVDRPHLIAVRADPIEPHYVIRNEMAPIPFSSPDLKDYYFDNRMGDRTSRRHHPVSCSSR